MTAFDDDFIERFDDLLRLRRDVRRFRTDPVPEAELAAAIAGAELSPSVGNSQPWRWVRVESEAPRDAVRRSFRRCNEEALGGYRGERAQTYASLKLAGLDDAPVHLAVFAAADPEQGHGLGRRTMPETLAFSVVTAVSNLWLAARARGIGVGWVSIVDPDEVTTALDVPGDWRLIAYLCLGYPEIESDTPELELVGWQGRTDPAARMLIR